MSIEQDVFPSYHMNKQKWVSILLDDTFNIEEVMEYINYSRDYMVGKTKRI